MILFAKMGACQSAESVRAKSERDASVKDVPVVLVPDSLEGPLWPLRAFIAGMEVFDIAREKTQTILDGLMMPDLRYVTDEDNQYVEHEASGIRYKLGKCSHDAKPLCGLSTLLATYIENLTQKLPMSEEEGKKLVEQIETELKPLVKSYTTHRRAAIAGVRATLDAAEMLEKRVAEITAAAEAMAAKEAQAAEEARAAEAAEHARRWQEERERAEEFNRQREADAIEARNREEAEDRERHLEWISQCRCDERNAVVERNNFNRSYGHREAEHDRDEEQYVEPPRCPIHDCSQRRRDSSSDWSDDWSDNE